MKKHDTPLRSEDVRQKNEKLILKAIQRSKGVSQSEMVGFTGLKAPTVLRIFSYLEGRGLIKMAPYSEQHRKQVEKKGRKPVYYVVNPEAHYTVGIEFWASQIAIIITDFTRQVIYEKTLSNVNIDKAAILVPTLTELLNEAIRATGIDRSRILGIGVGAPGRIDTEEGQIIFYGRIRGMVSLPLRAMLEKAFDIPVFVSNNASVVAVNAYRRGVAKDSKSLITVLIRSGVGGAFISEGNLLLVQGRTAMEIGHSSIDMHGPECVCGTQGCLEAYISEQVLLEEAAEILGIATLPELDQLLGDGDDTALALVRQKGKLLSVEMRSLNRIFSPDSFLIMTRFPHISAVYAEEVRKNLSRDFFCQADDIAVYSDVYDSVEAGRGAAELVFEDYFTTP